MSKKNILNIKDINDTDTEYIYIYIYSRVKWIFVHT